MCWLWKEIKSINIRYPKTIIKVNEITLLENCINLIEILGIKKLL